MKGEKREKEIQQGYWPCCEIYSLSLFLRLSGTESLLESGFVQWGEGCSPEGSPGSSWDISACLTFRSEGKIALEFRQGQNPNWFGEKNVQQPPAGWDHGQARAEGENRGISSGAVVCSGRAALLRDTVPPSRRQLYLSAYLIHHQLSQMCPRAWDWDPRVLFLHRNKTLASGRLKAEAWEVPYRFGMQKPQGKPRQTLC